VIPAHLEMGICYPTLRWRITRLPKTKPMMTTYDHAIKNIGEKKWNERMKRVLDMLKIVFNYDKLYIGGGNSSKLTIKLDENMKIVTNEEGIKGGARLWQLDENFFMKSKTPSLNKTLKV